MGVDTLTQAISIAVSAFCGIAAGLLYDVLRAVRYRTEHPALAASCDVFFCIFCTAEMFAVGMYFCENGAGLWEGTAFMLAFAAYLFGISASIRPLFGKAEEKCGNLLRKSEKNRR